MSSSGGTQRGHGIILCALDAQADATPSYADLLRISGFSVTVASGASKVLEAIHIEPPVCLVVPYSDAPDIAEKLLHELKSDHAYGHLPVVLLLSQAHAETMNWEDVPGDDYIVLPASSQEVGSRLRLCIERSSRDLDANPLTGLPGNLTIMREAERHLASGQPFALGYVDLDNFKPYNDKYGFSRGDEVLRMTARVVVNAVRSLRNPDTYVGHVGGDDFVFLAPSELAEMAASAIVRDFDQVIPNFYDNEDRRAGMILSVDRQGVEKHFQLIGCSIAIIDTSISVVRHVGELSARAAEVKKFAKATAGSTYLIDRRR